MLHSRPCPNFYCDCQILRDPPAPGDFCGLDKAVECDRFGKKDPKPNAKGVRLALLIKAT